MNLKRRSAKWSSEKARKTRVVVVGRSRTGRALAEAIRRSADYELVKLLPGRAERYQKFEAEILIIAVKDDKVAEVAKRALAAAGSSLKLNAHLAGSLAPTVLPRRAGVARLTLHPVQTFAKPTADLFQGISFMACSEEPSAIVWAKRFIKSIGARDLLALQPEQLPLYHTLTVFAANFLVLIGGVLEETSEALGQSPKKMKKALRPLMEKVLENVLTKSSRDVLSGPIKRKDFETIKKHRTALRQMAPEVLRIYDAFVKYAIAKDYSLPNQRKRPDCWPTIR